VSTPQNEASQQDAPQSQPSGGNNVFTRKIGPLPMWAWMGILLAVALGYYFWKKNLSASNSSTQNASGTNTPDQTTAASQIPQFVNQTFVSGQPPTAPTTPTPPGTVPPTNIPPADTYFIVSNGKESLATIAKKAGIPVEQIVQGTSQFGGAQNHGSFTKWYTGGSSKHGTKGNVPKGIYLFASGFQTGHAPTGWTSIAKGTS
jgi:hypothetical protein